tara:strand:- start:13615 stop:13869 length:255 start_codon:yes stop_codon:yes gene_type:complete
MNRMQLHEYVIMNITDYDEFLQKHEKKTICMFATFIHQTQMYHINFLDFSAMIFYLRSAKNKKFKEIDVKELTFKETKPWKAQA